MPKINSLIYLCFYYSKMETMNFFHMKMSLFISRGGACPLPVCVPVCRLLAQAGCKRETIRVSPIKFSSPFACLSADRWPKVMWVLYKNTPLNPQPPFSKRLCHNPEKGILPFWVRLRWATNLINSISQLPPPKGSSFEFGCKPTKVMHLLNPSPQPSPVRLRRRRGGFKYFPSLDAELSALMGGD